MSAPTLFFVLFGGAMVLFVIADRSTKKRNRRTRSGWRIPAQRVHDASCKSGWRASTQHPRF